MVINKHLAGNKLFFTEVYWKDKSTIRIFLHQRRRIMFVWLLWLFCSSAGVRLIRNSHFKPRAAWFERLLLLASAVCSNCFTPKKAQTWQPCGQVASWLTTFPRKGLKMRVLWGRHVASLLPLRLRPYLEPEFSSVSAWTSGPHHSPPETALITVISTGVQCYCSIAWVGSLGSRKSYIIYCSFIVCGEKKIPTRSLRPIDTAVSEEHSRWSGNPCCSSWCHTCSWSLCLRCPGCGSTSAYKGTIPDAGCMCRGRAATCL